MRKKMDSIHLKEFTMDRPLPPTLKETLLTSHNFARFQGFRRSKVMAFVLLPILLPTYAA
jgi:hypothetical protein